MALCVLTVSVAVIVFLIVPEKPASQSTESFKDQLQGVKTVFTSLDFWRVAPLTTLSQASFLSIQGLWAGPWLKDVAGLDRTGVAGVLLWVAVAMIAGFILLGSLADRLSRSGVSVLTTAVTGMGLFMMILLLILVLPEIQARPLWMIFGFFGDIRHFVLRRPFPAVSCSAGRPGQHGCQFAGICGGLCGAVGHGRHYRALACGCRRPMCPGGLSRGVRDDARAAGAQPGLVFLLPAEW